MPRMPQPKDTFIADHARFLQFNRDPTGGIAGTKQQKSIGRRRDRSVELPGDPSATGEDGKQEKRDQRAQGFSVKGFSDCHKVAGVQGLKIKMNPSVNTVDRIKNFRKNAFRGRIVVLEESSF